MSSRFFENQPNEICSHFREKASIGTFLRPKKPQNHSKEGKGKEKKKEQGEGKEEIEEKKAIVLLLVFIIASLEIVFGQKNCWTQKVYLAITLYKIQLDIQHHEYLDASTRSPKCFFRISHYSPSSTESVIWLSIHSSHVQLTKTNTLESTMHVNANDSSKCMYTKLCTSLG